MSKRATGWSVAVASALVLAPAAFAQKSQTQGTTQEKSAQSGQQKVAEACLKDLQAFSDRMNKDGYWLTGWGTRWGSGTATPPPGEKAQPRQSRSDDGNPPKQAELRAAADDDQMAPWGASRWGIESPRYQIGTLYRAANVLAHRGDQQACNAVLAELKDVYTGHVAALKKAGVEPGEITSWRQEQIADARPVTD